MAAPVDAPVDPAAPPFEPPFEPPVPAAPVRRRRWPRRVLIGAVVVVVLLVAATVGGYLYLRAKLNGVNRVAVSGLAPVTGSQQIFLIAGSDSRAGESASAASHFGSAQDVAGQRSDVIVLVRIDTAHSSAAMLSIPRDLFVPLAGTSSSNRINIAFDGGPSQLVQTITTDFGIPINHVMEIGFSGVQQLTNAVGGVCMSFPYPVRDGAPAGTGNESGLSIPNAGPQTLNGDQALALIRSRYYQYFQNGTWHPEGTGDIGRIARQHEYLRALSAKLVHSALHNPFTANAILGRATGAATVDTNLSPGAMISLGWHLRSLKPANIPSWTLPYTAVNNYGSFGDVLLPDKTADAQVISQWESYVPAGSSPATTANPPPAPSTIAVQVLNGSGVAGQAAQAASALKARGFPVSGTGNNASTIATTVVRYHPGQQAQAGVVAGAVSGTVTTTADASVPAGSVVLVTGRSFAGVAAAAPTTTVGSSAGGAGSGITPVPPWDPTPC